MLIGLVSLVDSFARPATATGSLVITPAGSVKSVPITTTTNYNKTGHVHTYIHNVTLWPICKMFILAFYLDLCHWQHRVLNVVELMFVAMGTQQCVSFLM